MESKIHSATAKIYLKSFMDLKEKVTPENRRFL